MIDTQIKKRTSITVFLFVVLTLLSPMLTAPENVNTLSVHASTENNDGGSPDESANNNDNNDAGNNDNNDAGNNDNNDAGNNDNNDGGRDEQNNSPIPQPTSTITTTEIPSPQNTTIPIPPANPPQSMMMPSLATTTPTTPATITTTPDTTTPDTTTPDTTNKTSQTGPLTQIAPIAPNTVTNQTNQTTPNLTNQTTPNLTNQTTGPVILGSCVNYSVQNQSNNGSNTAGQQGSRNNANQEISQRQTNIQNACTTEISYIYNNIVSSPAIQQQLAQLPPNTLIQIDTLTMCAQLRDHPCIDSNIDFNNVFAQILQDGFGNWILNGQVQNVGTVPHNQVTAILYLYDSFGNLVGQNFGLTNPSTINPLQNATITVAQNQAALSGTPQFFRVSYAFES